MHTGMTYERLAENNGLQWPCTGLEDPGAQFLHGRLWKDPIEGPRAPLSVTPHSPPVEELSDEYPIRLTTGRRLESYNTGAQSNLYSSPLHRGESLDLPRGRGRARADRGRDGSDHLAPGSVTAPVRTTAAAPWTGVHDVPLPDQAETNVLTIDATDRATAEFKATAIRVEKGHQRRAPARGGSPARGPVAAASRRNGCREGSRRRRARAAALGVARRCP
jgi:formate dehydrogenase major subunit